MTEPEIALVFTAEPWVEELHRHLSDHGGARVRSLVVEESVALEESYDVLVVSHRWPALTQAFVGDRARARSAGARRARRRRAGEPRAPCRSRRRRGDRGRCGSRRVRPRARRPWDHSPGDPGRWECSPRRLAPARLVAVGGPPGVGRTEIAIELAVSTAAHIDVHLRRLRRCRAVGRATPRVGDRAEPAHRDRRGRARTR